MIELLPLLKLLDRDKLLDDTHRTLSELRLVQVRPGEEILIAGNLISTSRPLVVLAPLNTSPEKGTCRRPEPHRCCTAPPPCSPAVPVLSDA